MSQYSTLVCLEKTSPEDVSGKVAELQDRGWELQRQLPDRWVAEFSRDFDDPDAALSAGAEVRVLMADDWVPQDDLLKDESVVRHLGPQTSYLVGPDVGPDLIKTIVAQGGTILTTDPDKGVIIKPPPAPAGQTTAEAGTKTDASAVTGAAANGARTPPAPRAETAELAHQGLAALGIPTKAWDYLGGDVRGALAHAVLEGLYESRLEYAGRVAWTFAPSLELLERTAEGNREQLAEEILKTREGLADQQLERQAKDVELRGKDVELKAALVTQQAVATEMLREVLVQMKKWTSLANLGAVLLVLTVLFAMAMTGWIIALAGDKTITDWALPAAIFALALFAISPAVLLLLQRPLKGIDEWTPSGKPDEASGGSGGQQPAGDSEGTAGSESTTGSSKSAASTSNSHT